MQGLKTSKTILEITVELGDVVLRVEEWMAYTVTREPARFSPNNLLVRSFIRERMIKLSQVRANVVHGLFDTCIFLGCPWDDVFLASPKGVLDVGKTFVCYRLVRI
jgi:hypothetical protein